MNDEDRQYIAEIDYYAEMERYYYDEWERHYYGPLKFLVVLYNLNVLKNNEKIQHELWDMWHNIKAKGRE